MTVVVGTAGHIDHGKTTLLHALTGMDADRLPDEQRRGLTIDVGYARGSPDDGPVIDFVDVPGHDRLVGNMLVGAGEIDACLLVVAADDGPRAQTLEHLALLDALRVDQGIVAITKADRVDETRIALVADEVRDVLTPTVLADAPVLVVSAATGDGLDRLRSALARLRDDASARIVGRGPKPLLAIDRAFSIRGFGLVVTGSSRGAPIRVGDRLDLVPGPGRVRVRGIQVHDRDVDTGPEGGRVALNVSGVERESLARGTVLTIAGGDIAATRRLLVALDPPAPLVGLADRRAWPPRDRVEARLHIGTDQVGAIVGRAARDGGDPDAGVTTALLRLDRPVAAGVGQRFVLRQPHPADLLAGGLVLDPQPPAGPSRRRQDPARVVALARAVRAADAPSTADAALALHGSREVDGRVRLADDVRIGLEARAVTAVAEGAARDEERAGVRLADLRRGLATAARRRVSGPPPLLERAVDDVIDGLVADGRLVRDDDTVRLPGHAPVADRTADPTAAALVERLDTLMPPPLSTAVAESGAGPDVVRALERDGRIVVVDEDLAWSRRAYDELRATAIGLAREAPMTPARLRDATGTSRKYVMPLLEDLARQGALTRTPDGHVPGPRA